MTSSTPSILITGGAGFIGSHTAWLLAEYFHLVLVDDFSAHADTPRPPQAELIQGDISNPVLLDNIFTKYPVKAVIHLAASISAPESVQLPVRYYQNNFCSTLALLQACIQHRIPNLLFASSSAVYPPNTPQPIKEASITQTPPNPYGHSKLMAEYLLQDAYNAGGPNFIILRYFNVAGADPQGRSGNCNPKPIHIIQLACRTSLKLQPYLHLYGTNFPTPDNSAIRDYVHVSDIAQANLLALDLLLSNKLKPHTPRILNCGSGQGLSVKEIIQTTENITKKSLPVQEAQPRPGDVACIIADISRIQQVLNWKPSLSKLSLMIEHTIHWEKQLLSKQKPARN